MDEETSRYKLISKLHKLAEKEKELRRRQEELDGLRETLAGRESELLEVESNLRRDLRGLRREKQMLYEKRRSLTKIIDRLIGLEKKLESEYEKNQAYVNIEAENGGSGGKPIGLVGWCMRALGGEGGEGDEPQLEVARKNAEEFIKELDELKTQLYQPYAIHELEELDSLKPVDGEIYLIDEARDFEEGVVPWQTIDFMKRNLGGRRALCISRTNPERLREKCGKEDVECLWLTESGGKSRYKSVYALEDVSISISRFIDENGESMVLVDGIEYLITNMGFQPTLSLVEYLRDQISLKKCFILLPVDFNSIDSQQLSRLKRECISIQ